jgi:protein-disulfide isomerase/uncharacterized membrane protein
MDAQKGSLAKTTALLVPTITGLIASAALFVDYTRPAPVFCEETSGCGLLKQTAFASFLGVPTPAFGLLAFFAIGLLALLPGPRVRTALVVIATAGAFVASWLLSIQFRFDVWCKYCCVADASAIVLLCGALWRALAKWDPPEARGLRAALAGALIPAVAAPMALGYSKKIVIPDAITAEMAATPKNEVTVIDFVDFECPFCRETNASLEPILASHRDHIRLVRKQVPLRMHAHAHDAALASCCGETLGKGDAMASALFSADVDDLTEEGCAKLAASLGLDEDAFRKCTHDPATEARIQADTAAFRASGGHGLPTIWIDRQKLEGAQPPETLERAITHAIASRS